MSPLNGNISLQTNVCAIKLNNIPITFESGEAMEHVLNKIYEKLVSIELEMNSRFDAVDSKFDAIEVRLDGIDMRLGVIDERLGVVEVRLDGIDERLGVVEERLGIVETRLDTLELKINDLQKSVKRIEVSQDEDIFNLLELMDKKLEETATKTDIRNLHLDVEFNVKESSLFKLELDRLKRQSFG